MSDKDASILDLPSSPQANAEECFEDLKRDYPDFILFLEQNKEDILFLMEGIVSEREISPSSVNAGNILSHCFPSGYSSSSLFAAEDLLIELLDKKRALLK